MNNPNHPLYNALGGNSNIHLLDNMLFTTDQHRPSLIPQYAAYPMETLAAHQHAMNLAVSGQSHVAAAVAAVNNAATTIDTSLLYQQNDHHQQQPISYKIPQVSSVLIQQHHQQQQQLQQQQQQHQQHHQTIASTITSLQEKKKDIVAQAMREEKIFEEINRSAESGHPKKTTANLASNHSSAAAAAAAILAQEAAVQQQQQQRQQQQQVIAIKSEPTATSSTSTSASSLAAQKMSEPKPGPSSASTSPGPSGGLTPRPSSSNRGRVSVGSSGGNNSAGRPAIQRQQQIMPRLQILEDEDDGLTCRMCLQPFWYKSELHDHMKSSHSISDPERYEQEEKEKKLRRIREEQQRIALAKQQRLGAAAAAAASRTGVAPRPGVSPAAMAGRGKGVTIGMGSRGGGGGTPVRGGPAMRGRGAPAAARPTQTAGPRPSFQYRDGAFICDLCKKSFSDGNDMVAHWKSHVKQQQQAGKGSGRDSGYAVEKSRSSAADSGRGRGRGRSAGRPAVQSRGAAKTHTTSRGRPITSKQAGRKRRGEAKKVKKGRSDKGKPRWTAYLVWSTRRRQEIKVEYPGYGFAEVGKLISEEWKEITPDDLERYKVEAERMNAANVRKLPKVTESGDEDWSENDDPSFNETNRKPIMLKIKKENEQAAESRSGRKRKRPSFFQEFENEESNLDKILDDFEQEQLEESKFPKPKRAVKNPGSKPRQRRRIQEDDYDDDDEEVELETTRSGRVRKVAKPTRQFHFPDEDVEDDSGNDEEKDEYQPDSEFEEPEEDDEDEGVPEQLEVSSKGRRSRKRSITLPPKKRSHGEKSGGKSGMSEDEIKKATMAALAAKPIVIGLDRIKKKLTQSEEERAAAKPSWVVDEEDIDDDAEENKPDETSGGDNAADDATLNTPNPANNPDEEDMDDMERNEADNPLEGSVTEDDPPENMFGDDDDDEINPEPSKSLEDQPPEESGADQDVAEPDANEQNQEESAAPEEFQSQEQVEDHQVGGGPVDLDVDPFSANVGNSATSNDDDLLSSAADTSTMEAGDEQYKSLIAESQMDNIFN